MSRFLICSFALVLLYPAGIDMYLVGLPRIAADLNASEAQLHIAFSVYLAGMAAAMLFAVKWPIVQGESLSPYPARRYLLSPRCSVHWLKPARYFLQGAFYRAGRGLLLRGCVRHFTRHTG